MFPTLVRTCLYINHEYKNTWNILYKHSIQAWVNQSKSTVIGSPSSLCKSKENGSLGLRRIKYVNKDNVYPLLTWFNLRYQYTLHSFSYESKRQCISKIMTPSFSSPLKNPLEKKNKLGNFTVKSAFHLDQSLRFQDLLKTLNQNGIYGSFFKNSK